MAQETIYTGTNPNDGTGDPLRTAFTKTNSNFTEVYAGLAELQAPNPYTVATLPSASLAGKMIYVSDESGGAVIAFSDGTNWRRVTDRAIVS